MIRNSQHLYSTARRKQSGRDKSYDADRVLPYGAGSGSGQKSYDGMTGRCAAGPRRCWCGEWVTVRELNAHWKAHRDGEV